MPEKAKQKSTRNYHAVNAWFRNSAGGMKSIKRTNRRIEKDKAIQEQDQEQEDKYDY